MSLIILNDKNAIKIYANGKHIGYIKNDLAKKVAPLLDKNHKYKATISEVTGGTSGKSFGCNYKITAFERASSNNVITNDSKSIISDNIMLSGKWYKRSTIKVFQTIWKVLAIIILLISLLCFILNVFMGALMLIVSISCFVISKTYGKIYIKGGQETIKPSIKK